jgi:predicted MFS family arabinose efflux permease
VSSGADSNGNFQWKAAAILFGILFLGVTDTALIPPLLPSIAQDLNTSPGRAGTVVTVYALAAAAFALLLGMASDRIGRKRLMCLALMVFAAASLITYQSSYFSTLLAARLLTGLSAGTLSTLAFSYAGDHYPYAQRGKAMGIISMAYFLVFVISIPAGTFVAARFDWRWVFLGLAVAGALMSLVVALLLPPDKRQSGPVLASSVLAHFRFRDRVAGMAAAFLTSGALVGFLTYVGVWLSGEGIGIERIGLLFMVAGVAATAAAPVSGWLADRAGKRVMILAANLVLAPLFIVVSNLGWGWFLFLAVGVLSVTAAARQAPLHALTTELVGSEVRGSYMAVRNAASQLGIAFATTISAAAFDQSGFSSVAWIAAIMTILILPACIWLKEPLRS